MELISEFLVLYILLIFCFMQRANSFVSHSGRSTVFTLLRMHGNDETGLRFLPTNHEDSEISKILALNADLEQSRGILPVGPNSFRKPAADAMQLTTNFENDNVKRYYTMVLKLEPNEMLKKFMETSPPFVQQAVSTIIMEIMGSLPMIAVESSMLTTSNRLANLLFQMQLTGYMFKNAEFRLSLTRPLRGLPSLPPSPSLLEDIDPDKSQVILKHQVTGETSQVSIRALMDSLTQEITALRSELSSIRSSRAAELQSNLMTYIRSLPAEELARLTDSISDDLLKTFRLLATTVVAQQQQQQGKSAMAREMTFEGEREGDGDGENMVLFQNSQLLRQLCMWQLVVGYKLREVEALEQQIVME